MVRYTCYVPVLDDLIIFYLTTYVMYVGYSSSKLLAPSRSESVLRYIMYCIMDILTILSRSMYTYVYISGNIAGARNNRPPIRKSGSGSLLTNTTNTSSTSTRAHMSSSGRQVNSSVNIGGKR